MNAMLTSMMPRHNAGDYPSAFAAHRQRILTSMMPRHNAGDYKKADDEDDKDEELQ